MHRGNQEHQHTPGTPTSEIPVQAGDLPVTPAGPPADGGDLEAQGEGPAGTGARVVEGASDLAVTEAEDTGGEPGAPDTLAARLQDEVALLQDRYLRTLAEFENYRKRRDREVGMLRESVQWEILRELLPVVDDLDRAVAALGEHAEEGAALAQGVTLVHAKFHDLLRRVGVVRIETVGRPFDPAHHEAVAQQAVGGTPPNQVVQEYEPGYMLHDRVLRHAKVVVSA